MLAIPPTAWETRAAQRDLYLKSAGFLSAKGMDDVAQMDADVLATVLRGAAVSDLPSREELAAAIRCPALILAWEDDPGHPLSTAADLLAIIPGAELVVASSYEQAAAWPNVVSSFLASL